MTIRLALAGLGKIARDQHLPAIAATEGLKLCAIVSRNASLQGLPHWAKIEDMLADAPAIDAVTLCTPPQGRFDQAMAALAAGKHLMIEKPPAATLGEARALKEFAAAKGLTLFATWHSRHAAAVEEARKLLAQRRILSVEIVWKEDVRRWHPSQDWIWQPGGFGVFDPGINALSIATRILPEPLFFKSCDLHVPENRNAPIAADLRFQTSGGMPVSAAFDWRQTGPQVWDISIETAEGPIKLSDGGMNLLVDGARLAHGENREYRNLYARFAELVRNRQSDADFTPLVHVADAFLIGRVHKVEPFAG